MALPKEPDKALALLQDLVNERRRLPMQRRAELSVQSGFWKELELRPNLVQLLLRLHTDPRTDIVALANEFPDEITVLKKGDQFSEPLLATRADKESESTVTPITAQDSSTPSAPPSSTPPPDDATADRWRLTLYIRYLYAPLWLHLRWSKRYMRRYQGDTTREQISLELLEDLVKLAQEKGRDDPLGVWVGRAYGGCSACIDGDEREADDLQDIERIWAKVLSEAPSDEEEEELVAEGLGVAGTGLGGHARYKNFVESSGTVRNWSVVRIELPGAHWSVDRIMDARAHDGLQDGEELIIDVLGDLALNSSAGRFSEQRDFEEKLLELRDATSVFMENKAAWSDFLEGSLAARQQVEALDALPNPPPLISSHLATAALSATSSPLPDPSPNDPFATSPPSTQDSTRELPSCRERLTQMKQWVELHFVDMRAEFGALHPDEEPMSDSTLAIAVMYASAFILTALGYLSHLMVLKDITRECFAGFSTYWGPLAGSGPSSHRRTASIARLHRMEAFDPFSFSLNDLSECFGPFVDFWCVILIHRNVIVAILFLSRYLVYTQPQLIIPQSSKLASIFLSDCLEEVWSETATLEERRTFILNADSTSRHACTSGTFKPKKWKDWPVPDWIDWISCTFVACIGVDVHGTKLYSIVLLAGHYGRLKYDPMLAHILLDLHFLGEIKQRVAEFVLSFLPTGNSRSRAARVRIVIELLCEHLGITQEFEFRRERLRNQQKRICSLRQSSAESRKEEHILELTRTGSANDVAAVQELRQQEQELSELRSQTFSSTLRSYYSTCMRARGAPGSDERLEQFIVSEEQYRQLALVGKQRRGDVPISPKLPPGSEERRTWFMQAKEGVNLVLSARAYGRDPKAMLTTAALLEAFQASYVDRFVHRRTAIHGEVTMVAALRRLCAYRDTAVSRDRFDLSSRQVVLECYRCLAFLIGTGQTTHWCGVPPGLKSERNSEDHRLFTDSNSRRQHLLLPIDLLSHSRLGDQAHATLKAETRIFASEAVEAVLKLHPALYKKLGVENTKELEALALEEVVVWLVEDESTSAAQLEQFRLLQASDILATHLATRYQLNRSSIYHATGAFQTTRATQSICDDSDGTWSQEARTQTVLDAVFTKAFVEYQMCADLPACEKVTLDTQQKRQTTHAAQALDLETGELVDHGGGQRLDRTAVVARWVTWKDLPVPLMRRTNMAFYDFGRPSLSHTFAAYCASMDGDLWSWNGDGVSFKALRKEFQGWNKEHLFPPLLARTDLGDKLTAVLKTTDRPKSFAWTLYKKNPAWKPLKKGGGVPVEDSDEE